MQLPSCAKQNLICGLWEFCIINLAQGQKSQPCTPGPYIQNLRFPCMHGSPEGVLPYIHPRWPHRATGYSPLYHLLHITFSAAKHLHNKSCNLLLLELRLHTSQSLHRCSVTFLVPCIHSHSHGTKDSSYLPPSPVDRSGPNHLS